MDAAEVMDELVRSSMNEFREVDGSLWDKAVAEDTWLWEREEVQNLAQIEFSLGLKYGLYVAEYFALRCAGKSLAWELYAGRAKALKAAHRCLKLAWQGNPHLAKAASAGFVPHLPSVGDLLSDFVGSDCCGD